MASITVEKHGGALRITAFLLAILLSLGSLCHAADSKRPRITPLNPATIAEGCLAECKKSYSGPVCATHWLTPHVESYGWLTGCAVDIDGLSCTAVCDSQSKNLEKALNEAGLSEFAMGCRKACEARAARPISELISYLGKLDNIPARLLAIRELRGRPDEAVPILLNLLANTSIDVKDTNLRSNIPIVLAGMTEQRASIAAGVVVALRDTRVDVRSSAAEQLGKFPEQDKIVVPALTKALGDSARSVRRAAASALSDLGSLSAPATSSLIRLLDDGDIANNPFDAIVGAPVVPAMNALTNIGAPAIPLLIAALRTADNPKVRSNIANILSDIGSPAIRPLIEALKQTLDRNERANALYIMATLAKFGAPAVEPVLELLDNNAPVYKSAGSAVLYQIDTASAREALRARGYAVK